MGDTHTDTQTLNTIKFTDANVKEELQQSQNNTLNKYQIITNHTQARETVTRYMRDNELGLLHGTVSF